MHPDFEGTDKSVPRAAAKDAPMSYLYYVSVGFNLALGSWFAMQNQLTGLLVRLVHLCRFNTPSLSLGERWVCVSYRLHRYVPSWDVCWLVGGADFRVSPHFYSGLLLYRGMCLTLFVLFQPSSFRSHSCARRSGSIIQTAWWPKPSSSLSAG
jgi:hypothetical protein